LAEFLVRNSPRVNEDLKELWRRIVFNICVSNVDDHLRNHGFLLTSNGWTLSPAFDMNPVETGTGLKLNISEHDNALDLTLALSVAEYFRLDKSQALKIVNKVQRAVQQWKALSEQLKISRTEQDLVSKAFQQAFRKL
jgi:serine/threonine-protein kinase HipA